MIIIISLCNYARSFCFAPVKLDITSCFITFHFTRFMLARVILCTRPSRVHCDTPGGLGASALCEGWGRGGVSVHASGSHMSSCDHTIQSGQDKNTVKVCVVLLWDMGTSSVLWIKWIVYVDNLGPYINPVVDNLIPSQLWWLLGMWYVLVIEKIVAQYLCFVIENITLVTMLEFENINEIKNRFMAA